ELLRAIVPADWPRLKAYAQHVRVFRGIPAYGSLEDLRIGDLQSLFASVNYVNFFPKLQSVFWNYSSGSGFISVISMFLPPQIVNISFNTGDIRGSLHLWLSLLMTLPTRCPDIEMVDLTESKYETVSNGIEIVSTALQGWSNLSSLHLRMINPAAFYYLTTLQGLKDLVLDFKCTAPEVVDFKLEQLSPCSLWPFPSLDSLVLACPDANFCSKILRYLSCSLSLSSLNLTFGIAPSLQWKTVVEKIKDTFPLLSSLTMRSTEGDNDLSDTTIGKEHFQPLYALQNLTSLELHEPTKTWFYPELAVLARTSRSFYDSAIQYLWSDIIGVSRLVKCMPDDLWEQMGFVPDTQVPKVALKRAIVRTDWPRFKAHARHVRKFQGLGPEAEEDLDVSDFHSLCFSAYDDPNIFPKLKSIQWNYGDPALYTVLPIFLSPQITSISFVGAELLHPLLSLVSTLPSRCPNVRDIDFSELRYDTVPNGIEIISTTLQSWSNLSSLTLRKITPFAFLYLSLLPQLKDLNLKFCDTWNDRPFPFELPNAWGVGPFPALLSLVLECRDVKFCLKILSYASMSCSRSLASLDLRFHTMASPLEWKAAMEAIKIAFPSLSSLSFSAEVLLAPENPEFVKEEHLRPLYALTNLTTLDMLGPFDLGNDDVISIGRALPRLKDLTISQDRSEASTRVTITILEELLRVCPCLVSLHLVFDSIASCPIGANRKISGSLHKLFISGGAVGQRAISSIAAYISDVAPNLESISYVGDYDDNEYDRDSWSEVDRLRKIFQEVREQEILRLHP
ncbi:hypothetical protein H0H93_007545, partial [Arthromyces matolae]